MIKLQNINVVFNKNTNLENQIFKNLNLEINDGEFVTVIGGNGAGKSTMMNLVSGNIIPNSGKVLIDNENVTKFPEHKRAHLVSRVFQDPGTFPDFSIIENLSIAYSRGRRRGLGSAISDDLKKKCIDILAGLGMKLEDRLDTKVALLSGGQRQALSLIMATLQESRILLLDEHTSALDPKTVRMILKITDDIIAKHKLTALMITHSVHDALEVGSRTLMMYHGKIIHDLSEKKKNSLSPAELLKLFE
jgi:putative ABC transport system ATP-binding protein